MPIGLFEDIAYEPQQAQLAPVQTLFLYTDGLTEARNARRELFGRERVRQLLARCSAMPPEELVDAVVAEVLAYSQDAERSDDLTLLPIRLGISNNQS